MFGTITTVAWICTFFVVPLFFIIQSILKNRIPKKNKTQLCSQNTYKKLSLLTQNESRNFAAIEAAAKAFNLRLFAKVRLIDIVNTKNPRNITAVNQVIRKHVDFLLCDAKFWPVCVIEIDDNSHNTASARARDAVKDAALHDAGVFIVRRRTINQAELRTVLINLGIPPATPEVELQTETTEAKANVEIF